MTGMIKLTTAYDYVWVNPTYIASIAPFGDGSYVYIGNDTQPTIVKENPDTIISHIQSLYNP